MPLKRNVLIFHTGALGDFVLSWPLAMALGRLYAQSRIFYVTHGQKGRLAERALKVESLDADAGGWHGLFSESPQLPDQAQRILAGAHAAAGFVAAGDSPWAANVRALTGGADVMQLAAHPPADFAGHHTDFLVQQLAPSVVWQQGVVQMVNSLRQRGLGATPTPGGPVIVHPGAGSPAKCWPVDRFVELATRLRAAGQGVRFVLGEVEQDRWPAADVAKLAAAGEVVRPADLVGLLDALRGASAFVGNDSGPGHVAGTLGLPTVSLFGPTDPARWAPVGPGVSVVRGATMDQITVDAVEAALSPEEATAS